MLIITINGIDQPGLYFIAPICAIIHIRSDMEDPGSPLLSYTSDPGSKSDSAILSSLHDNVRDTRI